VSPLARSASGIGSELSAGPGVVAVVVLVLVTIALAVVLGAVAARRVAVAEVTVVVRYE
jgi:hypothetical protein